MTCSGDSTGGATGPGRLPVSTEYVARYHPPLTFSSLYSRTQQHDGFEVSWNLLTGAAVTRKLHLNTSGKGDEAFDHIIEHKTVKRSPPVWLSKTPEPEDVLSQFRGA